MDVPADHGVARPRVGPAASMGAAMTAWRMNHLAAALTGVMLTASSAAAQPAAPVPAGPATRVLIVSGAAGSDEYAESQQAWRESFLAHATGRLGVPPDHVIVLAEREDAGLDVATAERVR